MELSVIVPCLNEEANLPELCERVAEVFRVGGFPAELVLVDDGSTDRTWEVIASLQEKHPFIEARRHPENRGIAAGWRTGVAAATGRLACVLDADLQYQPEDILRLRRELEISNVDIVQGWRSPFGREKGPRYWYSRVFNTMLNRAFGMDLQDNKSGFVLCAREVFADLLDFRGHYFYWQSFIMVAAHHKGYTYKQVETRFEHRRAGKSFLDNAPVKPILKSFVDVGRALGEYRFRPARSSDLRPFLDDARPLNRSATRPVGRRLYFDGYLSVFGATHWMMTKEVGPHFADLDDSQWLSAEAMRELQERKLRRLVGHAYKHVPYYRDRMRAMGIGPEDVQGLDDLAKLPLLTKDDVRRHLYFDILSDNHKKSEVLKIATSGSTGEPFVCYVDRAQLEFRWAATLRSQEWTGYRFGDRTMRLWHQTIGMSKSQVAREYADSFLSRRRFIPAYEMSDANLREFVRQIREYRPVLLDGYAESFNFLATYLKQHGRGHGQEIGAKGVWPKGIMSSAQTLPEGSRKIIEEAFGCRVFDKYGSREFSGIAYECEAHAGHHVVGEGYVVEVLKDGRPARPGEVGEVVITDLNNYCLPFLRYRIGDLAEAIDPNELCACGRGLPRIGKIEGRVQSIIIGADGQYVPGTFFAHVFKDYDHAIRQFQIVQERKGAITLKVVKGARFSDETLADVIALLHKFLGAEMAIDVEFCENIDMVRTGKRLATVSRLGIDFQARATAKG
jgi:phenylacetate-coenzyme A ligase PaaK-like adenylate-forming protein/glycosyltransferase involved in cell wall biosynthesis